MKTVLITGANGLVGAKLSLLLQQKEFNVIQLVREPSKNNPFEQYRWNVEKQQIDNKAIEKADYIIHLAGAGIADKRWTNVRKKEILDSRVNSTKLLLTEIKRQNKKLDAFVSASAVGYYGAQTSEHIFSETDNHANDFLGNTCYAWEKSADELSEFAQRIVKLRISIVLAKEGGALPKMLSPVKMGFGAALGSGKQYFPWIHINDLCALFYQSLVDKKMNGVYNAVAPQQINNKELTSAIANRLGKKLWLPNVPSFLLKAIFGELSDSILKGSRASSNKILATNYTFQFPTIATALNNLLNEN
jgi:uncharacterized protein (TIGR01777 family)